MNYGFRQWTSRPMSQSHLSFGFQGNNPWSWPHDKTALSFHKVREIDWPFQLSLASAQSPWCRFRRGRLLTPRTQSVSGEPRAGSFCASDSQWQALSQGRLASCWQEGYCGNWHSRASEFTQGETKTITIKCERKRTLSLHMDKKSTSYPVLPSLSVLRGITQCFSLLLTLLWIWRQCGLLQ